MRAASRCTSTARRSVDQPCLLWARGTAAGRPWSWPHSAARKAVIDQCEAPKSRSLRARSSAWAASRCPTIAHCRPLSPRACLRARLGISASGQYVSLSGAVQCGADWIGSAPAGRGGPLRQPTGGVSPPAQRVSVACALMPSAAAGGQRRRSRDRRHPEQPVAARRDAVLTQSRRRCVRAAPIWQHSGAVMRLGRPCLEAVQVAPTPRIRPREVQRYCEAHDLNDASMSRPFNLKLHWSRLVWACRESNCQIQHIRTVTTRPDARP